jgi:hypothetical protein
MSYELDPSPHSEYPDTNTYSNEEMHRMDDLRARALALSACIHKLSIAECPMLRYKKYIEDSHLRAGVFLEISKLQEKKSWVHVSLGNVALKINEIMSLPSTEHSDNIHEMLLNVKTVYGTVKNHIRDIVDEMISIGKFDLQPVITEVGMWRKTRVRSIARYLKVPSSTMNPLKRIRSRIDDIHFYFEDDNTIKNIGDLQINLFGKVCKNQAYMVQMDKLLTCLHLVNLPHVCIYMIKLSKLIESIEDEIQDMINEFSTWKVLHCSLALHPRLGEHSILRLLGHDLMLLVFKHLET